MLGGGAAAIAIAIAVIVVVALNLTGGDTGDTGEMPIAATEFPPHAHILGDVNAPVTVVEYGDFQ